jgi:hypothetical protein
MHLVIYRQLDLLSLTPACSKVNLIQICVIKFVSDVLEVSDIQTELWFPLSMTGSI